MTMRVILHLDADAFFAAVEQAADRHLRNKPVVVGGEHRGIVASASYEARAFGIHTPMPIVRARRLCRDLIVVPPRFALYEQFSANLFGVIEELSPVVERQSIDEGYVDLTGPTHLLKHDPQATAERLRTVIQDWLKVTVSQGLARNKLLSHIASKLHKPNGLTVVPPDRELAFLHPLPPRWLPGVGAATAQLLHSAGLTRIGQIAALPLGWLHELLGNGARPLRAFARNIDDRPVVATPPAAQSYGHQETFAADTVDTAFVDAVLRQLTDRAVQRLRADGQQARTLGVTLRYTDRVERQGQLTLAEPSDVETQFYPLLDRLRRRLWDRRVRLRMVRINLTRLYAGFCQPDLFGHQHRERELATVCAAIRDRFGHRALMRAHHWTLRSHAPHAQSS